MKFINSKKTMFFVFLFFLIGIVLFNFFNLTQDFTSFREYTKGDIENIDFVRVNINTADEKTLCTLPQINEIRARAIIEYREENGDFQSIDEILKVKGIGEKTFEKIKLNIEI